MGLKAAACSASPAPPGRGSFGSWVPQQGAPTGAVTHRRGRSRAAGTPAANYPFRSASFPAALFKFSRTQLIFCSCFAAWDELTPRVEADPRGARVAPLLPGHRGAQRPRAEKPPGPQTWLGTSGGHQLQGPVPWVLLPVWDRAGWVRWCPRHRARRPALPASLIPRYFKALFFPCPTDKKC